MRGGNNYIGGNKTLLTIYYELSIFSVIYIIT